MGFQFDILSLVVWPLDTERSPWIKPGFQALCQSRNKGQETNPNRTRQGPLTRTGGSTLVWAKLSDQATMEHSWEAFICLTPTHNHHLIQTQIISPTDRGERERDTHSERETDRALEQNTEPSRQRSSAEDA